MFVSSLLITISLKKLSDSEFWIGISFSLSSEGVWSFKFVLLIEARLSVNVALIFDVFGIEIDDIFRGDDDWFRSEILNQEWIERIHSIHWDKLLHWNMQNNWLWISQSIK